MIDRYTRPEIGALWTDEARMEAWRRVEVAAAEELDGPTASDLEGIRAATFTVQAVQEREAVTDHDVAAFVDVLQAVIVAPIATALHAVSVMAVVRGEEPHVGGAFRAARPFLVPAIGAVALAGVGIATGLVLLIVPGVYLAVRWYLAAVVVTVEGVAPVAALRRSGELVEGSWWAAFGRILLAALVFGFVALVGQLLAVATGSGALFVSLLAITQAVAVSLSAIFATLLFFDLRARKDPA